MFGSTFLFNDDQSSYLRSTHFQMKTSGRFSPVLQFIIVPILAVLLALVLSRALWPIIATSRFLFFYVVVAFSAWQGGLIAGMIGAVLSILGLNYILLYPSEFVANPADLLQYSLFFAVAAFVSWLENRRLNAERSLSDAKSELETIFANVSDGISVQDETGQVQYINKAALNLTNWATPQDVVKVPVEKLRQGYQIFDPNGKPMDWSALPRYAVFQDGKEKALDIEMRSTESNESRWFHIKAAPILAENGRVRLAVNVFQDVSERIRHEQSLSAEQQRLRRVLDNLFIFVYVLSPEGMLTAANRTVVERSGLRYEEVIGSPFEQTYWWAYSSAVQNQLQDAIHRAANGETVMYQANVRVSEQEIIIVDFRLSPIYNERGDVELLVASGIDITEQVKLDRERAFLMTALDAQKRRLDTIISNLPAIVWEGYGETDNQVVTFVSQYAEEMLGYSVDEWYQPGFWQHLVYQPDLDSLRTTGKIHNRHDARTAHFRVVAKQGRVVPVEAITSIQTDSDGNPVSVCGILMDITQRKAVEDTLSQYAAQLHRSNLELQQFAYIASHDLQEPLRMVTSYLQLVEERYADRLDQDGHEFIAYAVDGAARMKRLITDLLTYSRVQNTEQERREFSVTEAVAHAQANLKVQLDECETEVTVGIMPVVNADQGQVTQVFQNLISNAVKYRREEPCRIQISASNKEKEWVFAVQDNGIGIEEQYLDRIFVVFQRLMRDNSRSGTGIGLAICKKIVERHNGRIWAESQVGVGTTIYFTLPAV
jgi:PAS domain S-box-containing protein